MIEKKSLADVLKRVTYLPNRTPEMAFDGGTNPSLHSTRASQLRGLSSARELQR